jgi:F0F1-type ATP synthase membrane subunit c/vacuolar-type H+-ATPase subunit K
MPVPDFSPGEVLTAAAMDSIGLWLVKTQTVGSTAVSSVLVTDAFSSNFTNYRILVTGGSSNTPLALGLQMGTTLTGTGYYSGIIGTNYAGGTSSGTDNNSTYWTIAGSAMPDGIALDVVLTEPFLTRKTGLAINSRIDYRTNGAGTMGNGFHNVSASYTGFALVVTGGNFANCTIRVYGFRN